ncbi:leukemia inhibitory factor receptor [Patella vulgata]|uniref:leukemia inhibitory factor receptor n=1 Tax=Patella vulgata TaxID=6465 RepID=UPI0024A80115|nr:leukemia inhibitory factor receptor [Patella vulgata]XP_050401235.2 leukemia inhibitory factor receptor [Patella vulgata]
MKYKMMRYSGSVLYVLITCIFMIDRNFSVNGDLLPQRPYIYIGDELELTCTQEELPSTGYYFTKGDDVISPSFVTITSNITALLKITVNKSSDAGRYGCWAVNVTGEKEIIGTQFVTIEYAPQKVVNLTCIVYDWTKGMKCTWNLGVEYINSEDISVKVYYAVYTKKVHFLCPHLTNRSCVWNSDEFMGAYYYDIHVAVNNTVKNDVNYTSQRFITNDNVEPSPIVHLELQKKNRTCITITWSHNSIRKKIFKVMYGLRNKTNVLDVFTADQNITRGYCDLSPYTDYTFDISCKPEENGYWSKVKDIVVTTLQDVPLTGPDVIAGCFSVSQCDSSKHRSVMIYWGDVEEDNRQGEIIGYLIQQGDQNYSVSNEIHNIKIPVKLNCHVNQTFIIYSKTEIGCSKKYSKITVPASDTELAVANNLTVELIEGEYNDSIVAKWIVDHRWQNVSYHVVWCLFTHESTCQSGVSWKSIKDSKQLLLPVTSANWRKYHYGISAEKDNASSGLYWTDCRIKKTAKPPVPPDGIRITEKTKSLEIRWNPGHCSLDSEAYVYGYEIAVCQAADCNNESKRVYKTEGNDGVYVIDELQPKTNYSISLQAMALAGPGPESSAMFGIPRDEERFPTVYIVMIVIGSAVLLFFTFVGMKFLSKKICNFTPYKIKNPEENLDSNGHSKHIPNQYSPTHQGLLTTSLPESPSKDIVSDDVLALEISPPYDVKIPRLTNGQISNETFTCIKEDVPAKYIGDAVKSVPQKSNVSIGKCNQSDFTPQELFTSDFNDGRHTANDTDQHESNEYHDRVQKDLQKDSFINGDKLNKCTDNVCNGYVSHEDTTITDESKVKTNNAYTLDSKTNVVDTKYNVNNRMENIVTGDSESSDSGRPHYKQFALSEDDNFNCVDNLRQCEQENNEQVDGSKNEQIDIIQNSAMELPFNISEYVVNPQFLPSASGHSTGSSLSAYVKTGYDSGGTSPSANHDDNAAVIQTTDV